MKLLVVGTGSIGRRHARLARERAEVAVHDSDGARAQTVAADLGVMMFTDMDRALEWRPDAAVVATPHAHHVPIAGQLIEAGCRVLVEKPLADRMDTETAELVEQAGTPVPRLYVVCNMRFHPGPATLNRYLHEIGEPWFARAHFGQWLPDMRPQADYRTLYCARSEAGGGVVLDAIHEIDYLMWLFGPVRTAGGVTARRSDLEIDVEDYAAIQLQHDNGVRAEIHLDYLQACKRRGCELVGSEGTLLWESEGADPEHCRVRLFRRDRGDWQTLYESQGVDADAMYRALLHRFLDASGGEPPADLLDGRMALMELAVALAVKNGTALNAGAEG
ncbi:MAG: Gfo/Idh/MocA family oxidoreductase [Gammaproteobacteria bacterium]